MKTKRKKLWEMTPEGKKKIVESNYKRAEKRNGKTIKNVSIKEIKKNVFRACGTYRGVEYTSTGISYQDAWNGLSSIIGEVIK